VRISKPSAVVRLALGALLGLFVVPAPSFAEECTVPSSGRVSYEGSSLLHLRELASSAGEIQAIVGSIERTSAESPILKDHPGADQVTSEHWAFAVPATKAKVVKARRVRDLAPTGNVEGVAVDDDDGDWYLFDEDLVRVRHEAHP